MVEPKPYQQIEIRRYAPGDRERIRHLCCETGFLGNPIDPVFEDRELFADYLTGYYTDWEPESSWVLLVDGVIVGYLLGSRFPLRQQVYGFYQNISLFLRGITRVLGYGPASRAFVKWILCTGWREVPAAPRRCAHFHINLLPEARNAGAARGLVEAYIAYLRSVGEKQVYGQMVTFESRRGARLFERYGFKVLNRARISKYDDLHGEPVYLCTVIKDLEEHSGLSRRPEAVEAGVRES